MSVPTKDSLLATYAPNFSGIITLSPTTYNVTAGQATALGTATTPCIGCGSNGRTFYGFATMGLLWWDSPGIP